MYLFNIIKTHIVTTQLLDIFNKFEYGNFIFMDVKNGTVLLKKINVENDPISTVFINDTAQFFLAIWHNNELGLGESYVKKIWHADNILLFLTNLVLNRNNKSIPKFNFYNFYNKNPEVDKSNICSHYDVGNDFYETFLTDKLQAYTCGFFNDDNTTLEQAQLNKVNMVIKKMNTEPNKTILDIGCGWGKIANYVSEQTQCHVTGVTIAKEQIKYINENLPNITAYEQDYRNITTNFDYIYSIGILEHVRYENYDSFFSMIKRCLRKNGRCVIHTIMYTEPRLTNTVAETFISKHIFPGGQIPCGDWILNAVLRNGLQVIHSEFFGGQHYAKTLHHWRENMLVNRDVILKSYDQELINKFEYYFASCEAGFTGGTMGIGHFIITNDNISTLENSFLH
jgi:cyclopropane-fatty-acyl-phospholipid synthase